MLLDVVRVKVYPDYLLKIEFDNGEIRGFDMTPYMEQKPWVKLKTHNAFYSASVHNGTVVWSGNIDIDPETLYELSDPWGTNRAMKYAELAPLSMNDPSESSRHGLTTSRKPTLS